MRADGWTNGQGQLLMPLTIVLGGGGGGGGGGDKNISTLEFLCTRRLNESLTNDYINSIALRMAKTNPLNNLAIYAQADLVFSF